MVKGKITVYITSIVGFLYIILIWLGDLGLTSDGIAYIKLANSIFTDKPFYVSDELITQWPPLYTIIIALVSKSLSVKIFLAMKIWAVVVVLGIAALLNRLVSHLATREIILVNLLFWGAVTSVYFKSAVSESTFIFFLLVTILVFRKVVKSPSWFMIILFGFSAGFMTLTRFAGVGILAGLLLFYLLKTRNWKHILVILAAFGLTLFPWFWYIDSCNYPVAVRSFEVHFVSLDHLKGLVGSVVRFLNPVGTYFILLITAPALFILLYWSSKKQKLFNVFDYSKFENVYVYVFVSYLLFIFFSISFLDFAISFNARLLIPIYLMFILWFAEKMSVLDFSIKVNKIVINVLMLCFLWGISIQSFSHAKDGFRYTSKKWKDSPSMKYAKENKGVYYSNAANVMEYYDINDVYRIPMKMSPQTNKKIASNEVDFERLVKQVNNKEAVIILFKDKKYYSKYYSLADVEAELGFKLKKKELNDGIIYYN